MTQCETPRVTGRGAWRCSLEETNVLIHSTTTSPPGKWPLYGIETVGTTHRVYVTESEKAADAARSIGLVTVASAHESGAANETDWSPLAGRECVLLAGAAQEYYGTVEAILGDLNPPARVHVVQLSESGGVVDWLDQHDAVEPEQLRETIKKMADAKPWSEIDSLEAVSLPAFPLDALPGPLRRWVEAEAVATQTPAELPALVALATCSAILSKRVEVEPRPGWREPVNLYVAVLLEPGSRPGTAGILPFGFCRQTIHATCLTLFGHRTQTTTELH